MFWIVVLLLIGIGIHLVARTRSQHIQTLPDAYPLDVLSREPVGKEVMIQREDGSLIRAIEGNGTGPTVVLAHGFSITLSEWNIVWEQLEALGYRLIAFDQRGHGSSSLGSEPLSSVTMAEDYRRVLEHFNVKDGVLVGHSMGGFLSLVFLLNHAEVVRSRLRGVVLFATLAGEVLKGAPQNLAQIPMLRLGLLQRLLKSSTYRYLLGASFYGRKPSPAGIDAFERVFNAQNHTALLPALDMLVKESYYARLHEIDLPCIVLCGREDKTTPPWHSEELAKRIPNARMLWIAEAGHFVNWEAPEALVNAVQSLSPAPQVNPDTA